MMENLPPMQVIDDVEVLEHARGYSVWGQKSGIDFYLVRQPPQYRLITTRDYYGSKGLTRHYIPVPWTAYVISRDATYFSAATQSVYAMTDPSDPLHDPDALYHLPLPSVDWRNDRNVTSISSICDGSNRSPRHRPAEFNFADRINDFWESAFRYFHIERYLTEEIHETFCWLWDVENIYEVPDRQFPGDIGYLARPSDMSGDPFKELWWASGLPTATAFDRWESLSLEEAILLPWGRPQVTTIQNVMTDTFKDRCVTREP